MIMKEAGAEPAVLNIGVTGHRFLRDENKLRECLTNAVDRIRKVFPGRSFVLLSSLAEGADRLVADVILEYPGARLIVPLPLSQSEYMQDFADADSRSEFLRMLEQAHEVIQLPPALIRSQAYEAAGLYILRCCDLLVALWDGEASRGRGGTAEMVARALEGGKPVCHIWAGNNSPEREKRTDVKEKHGRLRCFNFPVAY